MGGTLSVRALVARFLLLAVITDGILYGVAGRLHWLGGTLFSIVYFGFLAVMLVWGKRHALDLLEERSRRAGNVKAWDRVLLAIYTVLLVGLLVVGALDGGRFRWSRVTLPLVLLGTAGFAAVLAWIWWAASVNAYLSRWARIQDYRGHRVADRGPYRYVRHPMYAAFLPGVVCVSLVLESWWALVPGVLIVVVFVIRTVLEDRMLLEELAGYKEYSQAVRYRLLPGIW